jgi:hypothetical protein
MKSIIKYWSSTILNQLKHFLYSTDKKIIESLEIDFEKFSFKRNFTTLRDQLRI